VPALKKVFRVLSTNQDRKNKTFASSMEGWVYPFFGVQFHPERNQFEWNVDPISCHIPQAIFATQSLVNVYINQARLSTHQNDQAMPYLIYNYPVTYVNGFSQQQYFFN
jgi:gamma-glutamyl hydrolase